MYKKILKKQNLGILNTSLNVKYFNFKKSLNLLYLYRYSSKKRKIIKINKINPISTKITLNDINLFNLTGIERFINLRAKLYKKSYFKANQLLINYLCKPKFAHFFLQWIFINVYCKKAINLPSKLLSSTSYNFFVVFIFWKLINIISLKGKKNYTLKSIKHICLILKYKFKKDPYSIIMQSLFKISPIIRLKKKKIAGRNHYIPLYLPTEIQLLHGFKLIAYAIKTRPEHSLIDKLTNEFSDIYLNNNNSFALKKKKELYALAVENKYYIKFL